MKPPDGAKTISYHTINYREQEAQAIEIARVQFPIFEFRLKSWAWFKGMTVEVIS